MNKTKKNDVRQATANNAANGESQDVVMVEATHQDSANNETPIHCHFSPTNAGANNGANSANDEAPILCQVIPPSAGANNDSNNGANNGASNGSNNGSNNGANSGSTDDTHGEDGAEDDVGGPNEEDAELMDEDTRTFGGCKIVETSSGCNISNCIFKGSARLHGTH